MTDIRKALSAADQILKGTRGGLNSHDFNDAMLAFAKSKAQHGESPSQALYRLATDKDPDLERLAAARDAAAYGEQHHKPRIAKALAPAIQALEEALDQLVESRLAKGESKAQGMARMSDDPEVKKAYDEIQRVRGLL